MSRFNEDSGLTRVQDLTPKERESNLAFTLALQGDYRLGAKLGLFFDPNAEPEPEPEPEPDEV